MIKKNESYEVEYIVTVLFQFINKEFRVQSDSATEKHVHAFCLQIDLRENFKKCCYDVGDSKKGSGY
jgi:hypothetical protein